MRLDNVVNLLKCVPCLPFGIDCADCNGSSGSSIGPKRPFERVHLIKRHPNHPSTPFAPTSVFNESKSICRSIRIGRTVPRIFAGTVGIRLSHMHSVHVGRGAWQSNYNHRIGPLQEGKCLGWRTLVPVTASHSISTRAN